MLGFREKSQLADYWRDPRRIAKLVAILGHFLVFGLALVGSQLIVERVGVTIFLVLLIAVFVGTIYAILSFRNLSIPFAVWILSIGGFRFLLAIEVAGLPDLYLDRVAMMWLTVIFMVKFFAEARKFRGPFVLDALILVHGSYLLTRIFMHDMDYFNLWSKSYLIPYATFFLAKNIVVSTSRIRLVLLLLLILSIYYNITSIAEKLDIGALLWPKYMLADHEIFKGRSSGPFRQAPLFGTIIGMLLPIHLYFIASVRSNLTKLFLYISLGLGFAGLYFTYTRGSWLAGIVALGAVVLLNRRQYFRMVAPLLIIVPFLAIMFLGIGQDEFLKERVENDNTLDSRVGTLATALRVWQSEPVFGVGFFQYRNVRSDFVHALEVPVLGVIQFNDFRHNSIHDIYFGPLAEEGLFGASLQFGIYFLILRAFRQKFAWRSRSDHFATLIMPILAGMFLGYLVGGIAIDYRFFSIPGTLFFMCAGILYGYTGESVSLGQDGEQKTQLGIEGLPIRGLDSST